MPFPKQRSGLFINGHELMFTVRVITFLKANDVRTSEDLTNWTLRDLGRIPNLGKKSINEIIAELARYGRNLKPHYRPKTCHACGRYFPGPGSELEKERSDRVKAEQARIAAEDSCGEGRLVLAMALGFKFNDSSPIPSFEELSEAIAKLKKLIP